MKNSITCTKTLNIYYDNFIRISAQQICYTVSPLDINTLDLPQTICEYLKTNYKTLLMNVKCDDFETTIIPI